MARPRQCTFSLPHGQLLTQRRQPLIAPPHGANLHNARALPASGARVPGARSADQGVAARLHNARVAPRCGPRDSVRRTVTSRPPWTLSTSDVDRETTVRPKGKACVVVPRERLGDRRQELRFEIIGDLWATLTTAESLPVLNLGSGGILVESPAALTVGSLQRLRLTLGDEVSDVSATVKHVSPAPSRPGRHLVGMAFVNLAEDVQKRIDAFVGEKSATPGAQEA